MQSDQTAKTSGKTLVGTVVKAAMKDTCTVAVERYVKHPKYEKYFQSTKKYLVHDAGNIAKVGDKVEIREVKPISKRKSFTLASIVKAAVSEDN